MRNYIIAFCLGAFSLNCLAQGLMHYTSDRYEYSVQIPEDWRRNDQLRADNLSMVVVSPENASLSFAFYPLKDMKAEEFIRNYQKGMEAKLQGMDVKEKGVFKSRDDEATYLLYDFQKDSVLYREKVCFYARKKEMAVVTARQSKAEFHNIIPVLDEVFVSFTFETKQEAVEGE